MPGRGSYGKGGKWIHDRAHHIMDKSPEIDKGVAYAVATQQAHKVGKSPKKFRTSEGVRAAKAKHPFPKSFYKKTASDEKVKKAFLKLKQLQKESADKTERKLTGMMTPRVRGRRERIFVPKGSKLKKRGKIERYLLGQGASQYKVESPRSQAWKRDKAKAVGEFLAGKIDAIGTNPKVKREAFKGTKKSLNPKLVKALKGGGLLAAGLGAGAMAHQLAHSVGLTETGPTDTLADMIVPREKYSYDINAEIQRRQRLYIPRYYLEKAAATMAGFVEDNESTMHSSEPNAFGPEASVVPQQLLDSAVPILQHVDRVESESRDVLSSLFKNYKDQSNDKVGDYRMGETEVSSNRF